MSGSSRIGKSVLRTMTPSFGKGKTRGYNQRELSEGRQKIVMEILEKSYPTPLSFAQIYKASEIKNVYSVKTNLLELVISGKVIIVRDKRPRLYCVPGYGSTESDRKLKEK